jgi:hypothetical protein
MEISQNAYVIFCGFLVWLIIAPRFSTERYSDWFLAYMAALLLSLIASAEIMMVKPVAFFFTVGGVFAFCYVLARSMVMVRLRK